METLQESNPNLLEEIHSTLNTVEEKANAADKSVDSAVKLWWQCFKHDNHAWQASIRSRAKNNQGCQICNNKQVLDGYNDLQTKYPDIAGEWHPVLNTQLTPNQVTYKTNQTIWWQCPKQHPYQMTVNDRTVKNRGCSVCSGKKYYQE